jgi:hypothetical protein
MRLTMNTEKAKWLVSAVLSGAGRSSGPLSPVVQIANSRISFRGEGRGEGPTLCRTILEFPSPNLSPQGHAVKKNITGGERDRCNSLPDKRIDVWPQRYVKQNG